MDEVTLELSTRRKARIVIGRGSLEKAPKIIADLNPHLVVAIVDNRVPHRFAEEVIDGLEREGIPVNTLRIDGGENTKSIETVERIWKFMAGSRATRRSLLLAVGGGALLDSAGFAASTYMRGVMSAYIPTTTLAQSDAAIGGKTGIDLAWAKNLVGVFYHPDVVIIDPLILVDLPEDVYLPGFAEVVKHAAIKGEQWVSWLQSRIEGIMARDPQVLDDVVRFSVSAKIDVIKRDYVENGVRAFLNYGHTMGHAIEVASNYKVSHGNAVAIGLVAESLLAVETTGFPRDEAQMLIDLVRHLGLPTETTYPADILLDAMRLDKKFLNGNPRIPLPRKLGDFTIVELDWGDIRWWLSAVTRT